MESDGYGSSRRSAFQDDLQIRLVRACVPALQHRITVRTFSDDVHTCLLRACAPALQHSEQRLHAIRPALSRISHGAARASQPQGAWPSEETTLGLTSSHTLRCMPEHLDLKGLDFQRRPR